MRLREIGRTFAILGAGHVVGKTIGLVSAAFLARRLGPSGLGLFATAITVMGYVLVLSNWGTDAIGIREIAGNRASALQLCRRVMALRLGFGVVSVSIAVAMSVYFRLQRELILPLSLSIVAFAFRVDWLLLGLGQARAVAVAAVLREITYLGVIALAVAGRGALASAAWAYLIADTAWAILTQAMVLRTGAIEPARENLGVSQLVREGWPMTINSSMNLTYNKIDTPMLSIMLGAATAGLYWSAYSILFAVMGVSAILSRSALPELSRTIHTRGQAYSRRLELLVLMPAAMGGAAAMLLVGSADMIMSRLYGPEYRPGADALTILSLCLPMNFAAGVLLNRLVAAGRQRMLALGSVLAAVTNVTLNLVLIHPLGMKGAALATLASESVLLGVGLMGLGGSLASRGLALRVGSVSAVAICIATILPRVVSVEGPLLSALLLTGFFLGCVPTILATKSRWEEHGVLGDA